VDCKHVHGFNMDEWSDGEGNTLDPSNPYAFKAAMGDALYGPLGDLTVPEAQRNFATRDNLPRYPEKIAALRAQGAKMATVFGIGRVFHVAFWEPHLAAEYASVEEWKKQTYRLGVKLHPITIEQNALSSFKGRTTLIPCRANTIGPGLFLQSDTIIGGCDGTFGRGGMQWQGVSLWVTLRYGPDMWIPSSFMPQLPGVIFYLKELTGPLVSEVN
jgi:glucosamine-6-phosphate deaminase